MVTRATRKFATTKVKPRVRTVRPTGQTREGLPAFTPSMKDQYVQTLLTNTMGNTFYATERELTKESIDLHRVVIARDPAFAAKAIVFARNRGFMRLQPIYGLAVLASSVENEGSWFKWAFPQVILTPKDLSDFAVIVQSMRPGLQGNRNEKDKMVIDSSQGGRTIKKAAGDWLVKHLSEYWTIKYGADKSEGFSLADLIKIYHPKYGVPIQMVAWLLGKETSLSQVPQIRAFERLKRATTDKEKITAITEGRLPHEVATSFAGSSPAVWSAIVPQLPIFALLKNLATLERHNVAIENREHIEGLLTNPEAIQKSKILPFRFAEASKHVSTSWLREVVMGALELSVENIPEIPGRVAVLVDVSGSMSGQWLEIAGIFGVTVMKRNNLNGRFFTFTDDAKEFTISKRDSILSQAQKLHAQGGTNTSSPIDRFLLPQKDKVDVIVTITDGQQNQGRMYVEALEDYRRRVNPKTKSFVVDVSAYRTAVTPDSNPLNYYSFGWSDAALAWISMMSRDIQSLSDVIEQGGLSLPTLADD